MRGPAGAFTCAVLKITNLRQVEKDLDAWFASVEKDAVTISKSYADKTYSILLGRSAQFSGDFVANWNISIGTKDLSFKRFTATRNDGTKRGRSFDVNDANYKMGDKPAMTEAKSRNAGRLAGFKLGDTIYFTNDSHHPMGKHLTKQDHYASKIEQNNINWRPGNVNAGRPVAKTALWMQAKYSVLDRATVRRLAGGV